MSPRHTLRWMSSLAALAVTVLFAGPHLAGQMKYTKCRVLANKSWPWFWNHHRISYKSNNECIAWKQMAKIRNGKVKKYAEGYAYAKWTWKPGKEGLEGSFKACLYAKARKWKADAQYKFKNFDLSGSGTKGSKQKCPPDPGIPCWCVCTSHEEAVVKGDDTKTEVDLPASPAVAFLPTAELQNPCDRVSATVFLGVRDAAANRTVARGTVTFTLAYGQANPAISREGVFASTSFQILRTPMGFAVQSPLVQLAFPGLALKNAQVNVRVSAAGVEATKKTLLLSDASQTHGGTLAMDPLEDTSSSLSTLAVGRPLGYHTAVIQDASNDDLLISYWLPGSSATRLLRLTPQGIAISLASLAYPVTAMVADQDGSVVVSTGGTSKGLYRVDLNTGAVSSMLGGPGGYTGVTIDRDTGDYILIRRLRGVYRLPRDLSGLTLITSLRRVTGVDYDPLSGDYFVSAMDGVHRVTPQGLTTLVAAFQAANAIRVDAETGHLAVASNAGRVAVLDRQGNVVGTMDQTHSAFVWTGIEIAASRKVSGSGPARAGTRYQVNLSFPGSPNRGYVAVLGATGHHPGIALPCARTIPIAPDPLTLTMLALGELPGVTRGFRGWLDDDGKASATIDLPAGFPSGVRVYLTAVAINPAISGGLEVGTPWSFTTN